MNREAGDKEAGAKGRIRREWMQTLTGCDTALETRQPLANENESYARAEMPNLQVLGIQRLLTSREIGATAYRDGRRNLGRRTRKFRSSVFSIAAH